ncbi:MAG: ribosome maturation factor RimP [Pseudomonadota bacterium]
MLAKSPMDEKIAGVIASSVAAMGYELVRVRLMGGETPTLQIMAERPDGTMDVEACADLSRALSAVLDVEDPIDREYKLEISSPGIDRPLTRLQDFVRYAGYEAKLETRDLIDGRKRFKGVLLGVEGESVRLETSVEGGLAAMALPFAALVDAKLVLTDALIAASLKGLGGPPPALEDGALADGAEVVLGALDAAGPDAPDLEIEASPLSAAADETNEASQESDAEDRVALVKKEGETGHG